MLEGLRVNLLCCIQGKTHYFNKQRLDSLKNEKAECHSAVSAACMLARNRYMAQESVRKGPSK